MVDISSLFPLPLPENTRGFFDPSKTNAWLQETALKSFNTALNKLESPGYRLQVSDLEFVHPKTPFSLKEQKQASLEKRDLTIPLKGTVKLIEKSSGRVLDEKKTTLAHVPYITERNTVMYNGSEYLSIPQQRLKPGVYTREKASGEMEAHINVLPGTGVGGKLIFYPDRALFVYQVATTQIKLYGLLKELGVSDEAMKSAWGEEIFLKNKAAYSGEEFEKFYSKIFRYDL